MLITLEAALVTCKDIHELDELMSGYNLHVKIYSLFDTDSDQNGMLEEIPRSGTDSYR